MMADTSLNDDDADDDLRLQAAIQESLASASPVMESAARFSHQTGARSIGLTARAISASVIEIAMIDQWGAHFQPSIREFETASAICGYVSCAAAALISRHFSEYEMSRERVEQMTAMLRQHDVMIPAVRELMQAILEDRYVVVVVVVVVWSQGKRAEALTMRLVDAAGPTFKATRRTFEAMRPRDMCVIG